VELQSAGDSSRTISAKAGGEGGESQGKMLFAKGAYVSTSLLSLKSALGVRTTGRSAANSRISRDEGVGFRLILNDQDARAAQRHYAYSPEADAATN
jgi:hypothetical protein